MRRQIIQSQEGIAVTEDGLLVEYIPAETYDRNGCILLGKVERMMPGLQCAFADIGRKKNGFLPLEENSKSFCGGKVRSGDTLILQIKKEEAGEKGAFLTRDITLPGKWIILMPMNRYIGVSSRIQHEEDRIRLKEYGHIIADGRYGMILRNSAVCAEKKTLQEEADELFDCWRKIMSRASEGGVPGKELWTDSQDKRLLEDYAGAFETIQSDCLDPNIKRQIRESSDRKVHLPGGGNIVIDRCEAMTVIDVNTASSGAGGNKEQNVLETNLEACIYIAQQVRLRNLSGIILIDFIDMKDENDRNHVFERLSEQFSNDRIKTVLHGWTKLGIMEMTRKRTSREFVPQEP